jgi:hypothetical protein
MAYNFVIKDPTMTISQVCHQDIIMFPEVMQNFGHHDVKRSMWGDSMAGNIRLLSTRNRTACTTIWQMPQLWWELANSIGMAVKLNLNCSFPSWK